MYYLLIKILNKIGLLPYLNINFPIKLNNKRFRIPLMGKLGFTNLSITEHWMIELLEQLLPLQEGIFVDIGVNVGQTLLKLRAVSSDTPYIGFEPNSTCLHYCKKLIELNNFKQTELIPVGLSENNLILSLYLYNDSDSDSGASIIEDFRAAKNIKKKIYVPIFNLASVKKTIAIPRVAIIKIDVEGAELEVLRSFSELLAADRPIIIIEILPTYHSENTARLQRQEAIEAIIRNLDYEIFRIIKDEHITGLEKIDLIGVHSDVNKSDYLFVPKHLVTNIPSATAAQA